MGTFVVVAAAIGGLVGAVVSGLCWESWEQSRRSYDPPTAALATLTTVVCAIAGPTSPVWFPVVVVVGGLVGAAYGVHRLKKWVVSKGKVTITIGKDVNDD